jgi:hypothetical protein
MLAGTAAALTMIERAKTEAEASVSASPGYERLTPEQLALDRRSYEFGRLAGFAESVRAIKEFEYVPGRGRGGSVPTADIAQETAAYVPTPRAAALVGRSVSCLNKWSFLCGSPCKTVIPYSDPSNNRLLLWKVEELRAYLTRNAAAAPVREIEPRDLYRKRRDERRERERGGSAAAKLGLR